MKITIFYLITHMKSTGERIKDNLEVCKKSANSVD